MVFSDARVAAELDRRFVAAWVNRRPSARFRGDEFDDLTAADLRGFPLGAGADNVTAIFARPDGMVLNAIPGYLSPNAFRAEMEFALELNDRLKEGASPAVYRDSHKRLAHWGWGRRAELAHLRLAGLGVLTLGDIRFDFFDD